MAGADIFPSYFPLGRRFSILMRLYYGALTKRLESLDIDRHYSILILLENPLIQCSQQYISDLLKIDKASMVRIVDYLVKKKYILRLVNPNDRREHQLCLTPKARKVLPGIHKAIEQLNVAAFSGMSAKQIKDFYAGLEILTNNLAEEPKNAIVINVKKLKSARK